MAVVNQKGGVGKTTTTANLAYALSKMGRDVLLIDFDSQASLTNYLNVGIREDEEYYGIYELMQKDLGDDDYCDDQLIDMSFDEVVEKAICRPCYKTRVCETENGKRTGVDKQVEFGFDLAPSHLLLSDYELYISGHNTSSANAFRLKSVVDKITARHPYDYVLIDCNPSLGIMAINAIVAATAGVLIPTNLDLMSTRGVKNLIDQVVNVQTLVEKVSRGRQHHMGVIGVVLNLYAERRTVDRTIQQDLERFYPFTIFKTTIPESVNAKKALFGGLLYSQLYNKAEQAYSKLAKEIEKQIKEMEKEGPKIRRMGEGVMTSELKEDDNDEE